MSRKHQDIDAKLLLDYAKETEKWSPISLTYRIEGQLSKVTSTSQEINRVSQIL